MIGVDWITAPGRLVRASRPRRGDRGVCGGRHAGLIGLLTSWNGFFLAGSRGLFSLGRGHIIHASFGQMHPQFGTPTNAVLFSGLVTFLSAWLGRGAILVFVDVGSLSATGLGFWFAAHRYRQRVTEEVRAELMMSIRLQCRKRHLLSPP